MKRSLPPPLLFPRLSSLAGTRGPLCSELWWGEPPWPGHVPSMLCSLLETPPHLPHPVIHGRTPLCLPSVLSAFSRCISTSSASPCHLHCSCHPHQHLLSWDNLPAFSRTGSAPVAPSSAAAQLVPLQTQWWSDRDPGAGGPLYMARNKNW